MIILYIRYRIAQSEHPAFLSVSSKISKDISVSENFHSYELSRCAQEQENFIQRIIWSGSENGAGEYLHCPPLLFKHLGAFKEDILEMRHYIPVKS